MTRLRTAGAMAGVFAVLLAGLLSAAAVQADHDDERATRHHDEHDDHDDHDEERVRDPVVPSGNAPVSPGEALYREECGSCHLAYPPGMLPAASWKAMLAELDRHFGQNAELDPQAAETLTAWLTANAAEAGTHPLSRKVLRSLDGAAPLRISEVPFIAREHREVKPSVWSRPAVGTVANCGACHGGAEQGDFDEDRIAIPK